MMSSSPTDMMQGDSKSVASEVSNESSPNCSRPSRSLRTPDKQRARIRRAERESQTNKTAAGACLSSNGSSEDESQTQAACDWIQWKCEDGYDQGYEAQLEELNKLTSDAELEQFIFKGMRRGEALMARNKAMREGLRKVSRSERRHVAKQLDKVNKCTSFAELEQFIDKTMRRGEALIAENQKMRKGLRKLFALMKDDKCDNGGGKGHQGK
ncbi:hypothetical protein COCOBI_15-2040 [Coccomyxa sp. Obi]|nr:hypothetical protein COCOBI_15-2040 [Coccomyxa sp. Obi]